MKRQLLTFLAVASLAIVVPAESASSDDNKEKMKQTLITVDVKTPLVNELVEIKPIENHHFNLEAPQDCGRAGNIEPTARKVLCQYRQAGDSKVTVSVCDNDKNYCKQEYIEIKVPQGKVENARLLKPVSEPTLKMQKQQKALLLSGFKALAPGEAKAVIDKEKGVLVLVSTEWCPPCNMLKEFMTSQEGFRQVTKDYLLVYVDGDGNMANQWRDLLDSPAYPTFYALNKDLEILDLKSSYMFLVDFKKWFAEAFANPSDSIVDVSERLRARGKKEFLRGLLDSFVSEEQQQRDVERFTRYHYGRFVQDDLVQVLKDLDPKKHNATISRATYQNISYGSKTLVDEENSEQQMTATKKAILATPQWHKTDWAFNSLVEAECAKVSGPPEGSEIGEAKQKSKLLSESECQTLAEKIAKSSEKVMKKNWKQKSKAEKLYSEALYAWNLADIAKLKGSDESSQHFKQCREKFTEMAKHSPLQGRSRASRIYTSYCLEPGSEVESMQLVDSLILDFPFDSTFYYKKASLLQTAKQYEKALQYNSEALKYSYGYSWLDACLQRARILKAMKKPEEAKSVINDCLSEVVLTTENRRVLRRVKLLRNELKTL
jgi:thiol-disulfide isomerase/thioredoxin